MALEGDSAHPDQRPLCRDSSRIDRLPLHRPVSALPFLRRPYPASPRRRRASHSIREPVPTRGQLCTEAWWAGRRRSRGVEGKSRQSTSPTRHNCGKRYPTMVVYASGLDDHRRSGALRAFAMDVVPSPPHRRCRRGMADDARLRHVVGRAGGGPTPKLFGPANVIFVDPMLAARIESGLCSPHGHAGSAGVLEIKGCVPS